MTSDKIFTKEKKTIKIKVTEFISKSSKKHLQSSSITISKEAKKKLVEILRKRMRKDGSQEIIR